MTNHERLLRKEFQKSGLPFLGLSFAAAMREKSIRIALECSVKSSSKDKSAPVQLALI